MLMIINLSGSRLELNAEVLREQAIDSQETDTGYGCRFIGVSHSQEETISRYIYKLQFEMLQKERAEKQEIVTNLRVELRHNQKEREKRDMI